MEDVTCAEGGIFESIFFFNGANLRFALFIKESYSYLRRGGLVHDLKGLRSITHCPLINVGKRYILRFPWCPHRKSWTPKFRIRVRVVGTFESGVTSLIALYLP